MKKRYAKKKQRFGFFRRAVSLALVGVMLFQTFALMKPIETKASEVPHGETKRYIVWYKGVPVVPNTGVSTQVHEQFLSQRVGWLEGQLAQSSGYKKVVERLSQMPYVVIEADAAGLRSVENNPNVVAVTEDELIKPMATSFVTTPDDVGGSAATGFSDGTASFTGDGQAVVVIDSGVDTAHQAFAEDTLIGEACYSVNDATTYVDVTLTSTCPGATESSIASGSAVPVCTTPLEEEEYETEAEHQAAEKAYNHCSHGTSVAALSVMSRLTGTISEPVDISGIAKSAQLIAIKNSIQFTEKAGHNICGNASIQNEVCFGFLSSTILQSLNRVLELANDSSFTTPIAAVNISQGGRQYYATESECDAGSDKILLGAVEALSLHGIATIFAAGNEGDVPGNANKVGTAACLSNIVAVGAAEKGTGKMTPYSNAGSPIDIVALGGSQADGGMLVPIVNDNQWKTGGGTSFAAPIISGAYAVMREKNPTISADSILQLFKDSGDDVAEDRAGYTPMTHKMLDLSAALAASANVPVIGSFSAPSSPTSLAAGETVQLNVEAEGAESCTILTNGQMPGVTVALTDGSGSQSVAVPPTGDEVTYTLLCADSENQAYFSQQLITFAVTGGTVDEPDETPTPPAPNNNNQNNNTPNNTVVLASANQDTTWVPGTPNSGAETRVKTLSTIGLSGAALVMVNRKTKRTRKTR